MLAGFAIATVSTIPIYAEPTYQSEQVSQLLFGERMIVFTKKKNGWLFIRCEWDHYEGWIKEGQVSFINERTFKRKLNFLSSTSRDTINLPEGSFQLNPGSSLFLLKGKKFLWDELLIFKGKKVILKEAFFDPEKFITTCKLFTGTPYLWGGRAIHGIDCSGFSQIVFKLFNYKLPRDAYQQAQKGENIDFLQEARVGDLAFFDNEDGHITHVGVLLSNNSIIHSTEIGGGVVIDYIDNSGIISRKKRIRTHNLRLIKRYF